MGNVRDESESVKKKHEEYVRQQNERCFLKDKQQMRYHSFILLESIPFEKINQLFDGLDRLYSEVSPSESSLLNYRKILSDRHSKLFQINSMHLPYLTTLRLKGKIIPDCAFHELGKNFSGMHISIYGVLPSTTILQIQVYLEDKASKEINDIIYKYHNESRELEKTPRGDQTWVYGPEHQKKSEIYRLKQSLHTDAVNFLNKYFSGYFFDLANEDVSVVPSVELFSLNFPNSDEQILKWGIENRGFLNCLGISLNPHNLFKYKNYLFILEENDDRVYINYLILANRTNGIDSGYPDVNTAIEETLNYCCFDLLAIDRLVTLQESNVGKLNLIVSQEIEDIQSNNFRKAIDARKEVLKTIFSFERFVAEYTGYWFLLDKFQFKTLIDMRQPGKQIELFKGLQESINARIKEINALTSRFSQEHEMVLNLKNLEFNKEMQHKVFWLTILIIVLAIIQIVLDVGWPFNLDIIWKFISWMRDYALFGGSISFWREYLLHAILNVENILLIIMQKI